jgi:glucosamine--fructose-6-phosphate aminotransferase (isomerizing)
MCGIMGYLGNGGAKNILLDGLKRLEYRGYDSAGIAIWGADGCHCVRSVGPLTALAEKMAPMEWDGGLGIGHTRWATHGGISESNAHPQRSSDEKIFLVHNGVIENHGPIRTFLEGKGYAFSSETDTEVLANLIAYHYAKQCPGNQGRFLESVRKALLHIEGAYGIATFCTDCPWEMVGARNSSPLVLGIGLGEFFLSSDVAGFAARTRDVVFLNDCELVHICGENFQLITQNRGTIEAKRQWVDWNLAEAELNGFDHFMIKEIFEQPEALANAMRGRFSADGSTAHLGGLKMTPQELRHVDRIILCACGTAWCACLAAEYLIEKFARIPVKVEYASEFRYRNSPMERNTLVMVISQSGETLDTLAAMREAQRKGFRVLAITNTIGSTIAREADGGVYQHAGPEVGVASTKAFTSQLCIIALLALYLGRMRDLSFESGQAIVQALRGVPPLVEKILEQNAAIREMAKKYATYGDMLYLGRQAMFPIALEGALKLKEISYVHAEGYAAAEMKHGPIALVSPQCPAFFLAYDDSTLAKTLSNMHEIRARGAKIIAVLGEESRIPADLADDIILLPTAHPIVRPILGAIPVQLFAYHMGILRGCDVDRPRNLAKSVTVE